MTRYSVTGINQEQISSLGISGLKILKHTGIVFAELTPEQVNKLRLMGSTVEPMQNVKTGISAPVPILGTQTFTPQYLVQVAGFDVMRMITTPPLYGQGINVAVIDTGIRETHSQLNNRVVFSKNYTKDAMVDGFNHATGVASIIIAVAPLCNILNLKVLDSDGKGTTEEVIDAIEDCIDLWHTNPTLAPVLINLSIGAPDSGNPNDPLRVACRAALENRIWVSAAAGNGGPEPMTIFTPASEKYVYATGSINAETMQVSKFSSRGPTAEGESKPDAVFFGENIIMASSEGDQAVVGKSGTSFATSFSTGIAALFIEGASAYRSTRQVNSQSDDGSKDLEVNVSLSELLDKSLGSMCVKPESVLPGKDYDYGFGIPVGDLTAQAVTGKSSKPVSFGNSISAVMMAGAVSIMMKILPGAIRR